MTDEEQFHKPDPINDGRPSNWVLTVLGAFALVVMIGLIAGLKPESPGTLEGRLWDGSAAVLAASGVALSGWLPKSSRRTIVSWVGIVLGVIGLGLTVGSFFRIA